MYHASLTVRCRVGRETSPGPSSKWAMLPPGRRTRSRTCDPSGAMASCRVGRSASANGVDSMVCLRGKEWARAVILVVIPPGRTAPNWTALARIQAQPDLPGPVWTVETRRLAVITGAIKWGDANFALAQLRHLRGHTLWPP